MLKPGRYLDLLIARDIMGWRDLEADDVSMYGTPPTRKGTDPHDHFQGTGSGKFHVPRYSTKLECAWDVLTSDPSRFNFTRGLSSSCGEDFKLCRDYPKCTDYWVEYMTPGGLEKGPTGMSLPHAICLAALEACIVGSTQCL